MYSEQIPDIHVPPSQFSRLGIQVSLAIYVCLSGIWLGGLFYLSFLSYFFKLVCYAHVFPCIFVLVKVHVCTILGLQLCTYLSKASFAQQLQEGELLQSIFLHV